MSTQTPEPKHLRLTFHGRILDHLGIQMYQSPVASIAELVSNAWDADSEKVRITLPPDKSGEIAISDNGAGMTFKECQEHYLQVGWRKREDENQSGDKNKTAEKQRPVLGRKGIGKFAGFGIAQVVEVSTVSKATGEKTVFLMDIAKLRTDEYIQDTGGEVDIVEYLKPNETRKDEHGTTITLKSLTLSRTISADQFGKSMARRFLLHQRADDFQVSINNSPLPTDQSLEGVEYVFPRDYSDQQKPAGLGTLDEWGVETLSNGRKIKWRFAFTEEPIDEEELRGIAVFSRGKLAQNPFLFNLSGGLGGQHGQEYLSGQVEADYIDDLSEDIISPERQRINWEHDQATPLLTWGQERVKQLLRIWRDQRGEKRRQELENKVLEFSDRLGNLPLHEQQTVKRALTRLGGIPALSKRQFSSLGAAILTAWEKGRLRALIAEMSAKEDVTSDWLLQTLTEADVLIALNLAEAVRTKKEAIISLESLVDKGELENAVRDYIAKRPYLLSEKWETFKIETALRNILETSANEARLTEDEAANQGKRIDLALRSGEHLLVVEFMRPGKTLDQDHTNRCETYVRSIRVKTDAERGHGIKRVSGLIVADRIANDAVLNSKLRSLAQNDDIRAFSWSSLIAKAKANMGEYLEIISERAPHDTRLQGLLGDITDSEDEVSNIA